MRQRAFASMPSTVSEDGRSFDVTIYTETPVRTLVLDPRTNVYVEADEVLLASGLDLSQSPRMPLVNNHDSFGDIRTSVLGRIDDIRVEDKAVIGRATLSNLHADLAKDIVEGFLGNISATYWADQYEFKDRANDVPLAIAHKTVLLDGSMVPVGADPNASVRGHARTFPAPKLRSQTTQETQTMDKLETAVTAAEDAVAALDAAVEAAGEDADPALLERAAKLRAADDEKKDPADGDGGDAAAAGGEGGDAEPSDDEKKKEDEAVRGLRSIASTYGMTKLVDDAVMLGARSAEIKASLKDAVLKRGAAPASPAGNLKPKQTADEPLSARSIYARINGKGAK